MQSVWLVERGEYSDYRVEAIFATKEQADACAAQMLGSYGRGNATVTEWPLNTWTPEQAKWSFCFSMDGQVIGERVDAFLNEPSGEVFPYRREPDSLWIEVKRGPREVALKIASERYTRIRAFLDEADSRTKKADYRRISEGCSLNDALEVAEILAGIAPVPNPPRCIHHEDILMILGIPKLQNEVA